eukprot:TRINITY_DN21928_c0_g1_i1.p1 TRINITY_DN21928_c0_g1~~TRINITY_DN21928_c0_g1_i1.p1  ORF type:complete len:403 (-),score=46.48 TRINITY_DN21928_c0_g1_i1:264-1430(-)
MESIDAHTKGDATAISTTCQPEFSGTQPEQDDAVGATHARQQLGFTAESAPGFHRPQSKLLPRPQHTSTRGYAPKTFVGVAMESIDAHTKGDATAISTTCQPEFSGTQPEQDDAVGATHARQQIGFKAESSPGLPRLQSKLLPRPQHTSARGYAPKAFVGAAMESFDAHTRADATAISTTYQPECSATPPEQASPPAFAVEMFPIPAVQEWQLEQKTGSNVVPPWRTQMLPCPQVVSPRGYAPSVVVGTTVESTERPVEAAAAAISGRCLQDCSSTPQEQADVVPAVQEWQHGCTAPWDSWFHPPQPQIPVPCGGTQWTWQDSTAPGANALDRQTFCGTFPQETWASEASSPAAVDGSWQLPWLYPQGNAPADHGGKIESSVQAPFSM